MEPLEDRDIIRVPVKPLYREHGFIPPPPSKVVAFTRMCHQMKDEHGSKAYGFSYHCDFCRGFIVDWYPGTLLETLRKHAQSHYD